MIHPSDFSKCVFTRISPLGASYIDYDDCICGRTYVDYLAFKESR